MEHLVAVTEDPVYGVEPVSNFYLKYTDADEAWEVFALVADTGFNYVTIYMADSLNAAIVGAKSLKAGTGPTGGLSELDVTPTP